MPDSDRNRSWLGKLRNRLGLAGYPAMRIVALAETGTRGLLGAVIGGPGERAEVPLARKLVTLLGEGMLLLADRAYDAADLLTAIAATGAHFLVRGSASRKPGAVQILPGASYLSQVDWRQVRIIEADLDVHGADGCRIGDSYWLITTLLDWRRYPAGELMRLTMSAGKSRSPTWRCGTPCSAGTYCAPATGPAPSRNYGRCWPPARRCGWP